MTPDQALKLIQKNNIKLIDLKFCDFLGLWQHFTITDSLLNAETFTEGVGFDGSSIRGFQKINESDMLLFPDATTYMIDPIASEPTASFICNVLDPVSSENYSRDPRYVAIKAEKYLRSSGIADISYWGPEIEFYIFDHIRFDQDYNYGYYYIDSIEGNWNTGRDDVANLGYKPRYKEGYFPVAPMDHYQDLRSEMVTALRQSGINVEIHHHEVGSAGQTEIDMRFDSLVAMADQVLLYKYIVKNIAKKHGKTVTMMPKPIFQDNGSGMHVHQSLWRNNQNLFYDQKGYALLSDLARHYIGGLLKHAHALCALIAPTTNSYRRLVPGYEAPIHLVYSQRNRSACIRIPTYSTKPEARRIEFRTGDPSCNPYFAFSAMLMAGIDGIINKIEPTKPIEKNLYDLSEAEAQKLESVPASLDEALQALEQDHAFLLRGHVFTEDVIHSWIEYKFKNEINELRTRPHPHEFHLYFDT